MISAEITGLALTDVEVARFIAKLARNPLTNVVDLVYSKEKEVGAQTLRQFRIKWQLKRGADVFDMAGLHWPKTQGRRDDAAAPEKMVGL